MSAGLLVALVLLVVLGAAVFLGEDTRDGRDWQARSWPPPHDR